MITSDKLTVSFRPVPGIQDIPINVCSTIDPFDKRNYFEILENNTKKPERKFCSSPYRKATAHTKRQRKTVKNEIIWNRNGMSKSFKKLWRVKFNSK